MQLFKSIKLGNNMILRESQKQVQACLLNNKSINLKILNDAFVQGISPRTCIQIFALLRSNCYQHSQYSIDLKQKVQTLQQLKLIAKQLIETTQNKQLKQQLIQQYAHFLFYVLGQQYKQISRILEKYYKKIQNVNINQNFLFQKKFILQCSNETLSQIRCELKRHKVKFKQSTIKYPNTQKAQVFLLQIETSQEHIFQKTFIEIRKQNEQFSLICNSIRITSKVQQENYSQIKKYINKTYFQQLPQFRDRNQTIKFIEIQTAASFFLLCKSKKIKVVLVPQKGKYQIYYKYLTN